MMTPSTARHAGARWPVALTAIALLGAACASAPPAPPAALQDAQQAITAAERIDAGQHAPGEIGEARSKLIEATAAAADGKTVNAERLALQSRAAAELASAKTASTKALAENAAIRTGNAALLDEMNRAAGDTQ